MLEEKERIMKFQLPKKQEVKAYALEKPDGSFVIRGEDEIDAVRSDVLKEWQKQGKKGV